MVPVKIKRQRRSRGWLVLVLGMLVLYGASLWGRPEKVRIDPAPQPLVTREERLPAQQFHAVSLFSGASEALCRAEAAAFAPRGAAGTVLRQNGIFHAVGAIFDDADGAQASASAISAAENIDAQPILLEAPAANLRMTASDAQAAALHSADAAAVSAIQELGNIAALIDAGEIDLVGAQGRLSAQKMQLSARAGDLSAKIPGKTPALALQKLLQNTSDSMQELCDQNFARMELSSAVRALQIRLICDFCAWRSGLQS